MLELTEEPPDDEKPDRLLLAEGYLWIGLLVLGAFVVIAFWVAPAFAHPGGLAADDCHMNRSAGVRHCHREPRARPAPAPARGGWGEVYYPNCAAARAAEAAPVRIGQPGYGRHLDRDGDGVGCE